MKVYVIGIICLIVILTFLLPVIVLLGWNSVRELWPNLPQASYWQVFWITNAIQFLLKSSYTINKNS